MSSPTTLKTSSETRTWSIPRITAASVALALVMTGTGNSVQDLFGGDKYISANMVTELKYQDSGQTNASVLGESTFSQDEKESIIAISIEHFGAANFDLHPDIIKIVDENLSELL